MKKLALALWHFLGEVTSPPFRLVRAHGYRVAEFVALAVMLGVLTYAEGPVLVRLWRWSRQPPQCYFIDLVLTVGIVAWWVSRWGSKVAGALRGSFQAAPAARNTAFVSPPPSHVWRIVLRCAVVCFVLLLLGELAQWKQQELIALGDWSFQRPQWYLLGLVGICAVAYHWLARRSTRFEYELQESHYERFRRLEGLFNAFSPAVRDLSTNRRIVQEFERQRVELEQMVDPWTNDFARDDAGDFVHGLHLVFLQLAPIDHLHFSIKTMESDYRQVAGPAIYDAYVASAMRQPTDAPMGASEYERFLRADAMFLANETRRQEQLKQHAESARQVLLRAAFRSWWLNTVPLLGVVVIYLTCQNWVDQVPSPVPHPPGAPRQVRTLGPTHPTPGQANEDNQGGMIRATDAPEAAATRPEAKNTGGTDPVPDDVEIDFAERYLVIPGTTPSRSLPVPQETWQANAYTTLFDALVAAALLALAGIAGVTGGLVSVVQRVQTGVPDSDPGTDLRELTQAETAVFFAPVTGLIFAVVLSGIFAGNFVTAASLFPTLPAGGTPWYYVLWSNNDLPKWLLWAFIAGFSERLVPDMLDRFTEQAEQAAKNPSPAGVNGAAALTQGRRTDLPGAPADGAASTGTPSLDPYKDALPPDATEITVTGENLDDQTQVFVNKRPKPVLSAGGNSLRLALDASELEDRKEVNLSAKNSGAMPSDSNVLTITIGEPGG